MNATDPGQRSQRIGAVGWCRSIAGRCVGVLSNKYFLFKTKGTPYLKQGGSLGTKTDFCIGEGGSVFR